jgi:uncharacterized protein YebE (UPF0316 family)
MVAISVFFARMLQNAIGTVRDILVIKGNRGKAAACSFLETLLWMIVFCWILRDFFDSPLSIQTLLNFTAFAAGYAAGTYVGVSVEERMAVGHVTVQVISARKSREVGRILRDRIFPITTIRGRGRYGPRLIYQSVIPRRKLADLLHSVEKEDPEAFITIMDTKTVRGERNRARR